MPTELMKPLHVFVPFETIERKEDGAYLVEGYAFVNEVVGGEGGIRLKRSAMEAATPDYLKYGAIREMHQPIAAGTCLQATWDEKGCRLRAEIVDDAAIKKIERKVYKGFSVGVNPKLMRGKEVEECEWPETSLVDRPKDPDALFLHRAQVQDPEADIPVEVVAVPPAPVDLPAPAPSSDTGNEELSPAAVDPSSASSAAAGDLSPDVPGIWRVVSAELSEESTEAERRAHLAQALTDLGHPVASVESWAAEADVTLTRAQTTETVPIRENLEGPARRTVPLPKGAPPMPAPSSPSHKPAAPPPIPPGMKPVKRAEEPEWLDDLRAELARIQQGFRKLEELGIIAPPADLERVIKKEGDKYCVYSESGKKLGEHDTREEAEKQLQAIEIEKHKDEPGATQPKKDKERVDTVEDPSAERYQLRRLRSGELAVLDVEAQTLERFTVRELAEARLAELRAAGAAQAMLETAAGTEAPKPKSYDEARGDRAATGLVYTIEDAYMALMDSFYSILGSDAEDKGSLIRKSAEQFASHIVEMAKAKKERGELEPFLVRLSEISRADERESLTAALTRAETAEAELARVQAAQEDALTRLAAAEARVVELERMPAEAPRIFRHFHPLDRYAMQALNELDQQENAETERLRGEYQRARQVAEEEPDQSRRYQAVDRMMTYKALLAERGVQVD